MLKRSVERRGLARSQSGRGSEDGGGYCVEWWVDRQRVGVSSLAQGFWSQEYYLFVGLKG